MNVLELFALTLLIWLANPALIDFLQWLLVSDKYRQYTPKSEVTPNKEVWIRDQT